MKPLDSSFHYGFIKVVTKKLTLKAEMISLRRQHFWCKMTTLQSLYWSQRQASLLLLCPTIFCPQVSVLHPANESCVHLSQYLEHLSQCFLFRNIAQVWKRSDSISNLGRYFCFSSLGGEKGRNIMNQTMNQNMIVLRKAETADGGKEPFLDI